MPNVLTWWYLYSVYICIVYIKYSCFLQSSYIQKHLQLFIWEVETQSERALPDVAGSFFRCLQWLGGLQLQLGPMTEPSLSLVKIYTGRHGSGAGATHRTQALQRGVWMAVLTSRPSVCSLTPSFLSCLPSFPFSLSSFPFNLVFRSHLCEFSSCTTCLHFLVFSHPVGWSWHWRVQRKMMTIGFPPLSFIKCPIPWRSR